MLLTEDGIKELRKRSRTGTAEANSAEQVLPDGQGSCSSNDDDDLFNRFKSFM